MRMRGALYGNSTTSLVQYSQSKGCLASYYKTRQRFLLCPGISDQGRPLLLLLLLLLLLATMTLNQVQSFRINHQAGSHYINI